MSGNLARFDTLSPGTSTKTAPFRGMPEQIMDGAFRGCCFTVSAPMLQDHRSPVSTGGHPVGAMGDKAPRAHGRMNATAPTPGSPG
jgi:hypothetical protein